MTQLTRITTIVGTAVVLTLAGGTWSSEAVAATAVGSTGSSASVPFGSFEAASSTDLGAWVMPLTGVGLLPTLEQRRGRGGGSRAGRGGRAAPRGRVAQRGRGGRGAGRRVVVRNRYYPYYGYSGFYGYPYYGYGYGYVGYPYYGGGYYGGGNYSNTGSVRLKVKPRDAEVLVDGYFVGSVDDFDGAFQSLHLEPGPKHIAVRSPGFETLSFDVRILPGRKTTYEANMRAGDPGPPPTPMPPPATRQPPQSPQSGVAVEPPSSARDQAAPAGYDQAPPPYGGVRLKVQPRNAQVFVDGYFVGTVDDFDGGRGLPLESGPQRIEFRAEGFESMEIQVRILPNETITYEGVLTPMGNQLD